MGFVRVPSGSISRLRRSFLANATSESVGDVLRGIPRKRPSILVEPTEKQIISGGREIGASNEKGRLRQPAGQNPGLRRPFSKQVSKNRKEYFHKQTLAASGKGRKRRPSLSLLPRYPPLSSEDARESRGKRMTGCTSSGAHSGVQLFGVQLFGVDHDSNDIGKVSTGILTTTFLTF
jgi:hypothetical protein